MEGLKKWIALLATITLLLLSLLSGLISAAPVTEGEATAQEPSIVEGAENPVTGPEDVIVPEEGTVPEEDPVPGEPIVEEPAPGEEIVVEVPSGPIPDEQVVPVEGPTSPPQTLEPSEPIEPVEPAAPALEQDQAAVPEATVLGKPVVPDPSSISLKKDIDEVSTGIGLTKRVDREALTMSPGDSENVTFTVEVTASGEYTIKGNIFIMVTGDYPVRVKGYDDHIQYKLGSNWFDAVVENITTDIPIWTTTGDPTIPVAGGAWQEFSYSGTFEAPDGISAVKNGIQVTIWNHPEGEHTFPQPDKYEWSAEFTDITLNGGTVKLKDAEELAKIGGNATVGITYDIESVKVNGVEVVPTPVAPDFELELDLADAPFEIVIVKKLTASSTGEETHKYNLKNTATLGDLSASADVDITVTEQEQPCGWICGFKVIDEDCSGTLTHGDWLKSGVVINLYANDVLVDTAVTGMFGIPGFYCFTGLAPGTYVVKELVPDGYHPSYPTNGEYTVILGEGEHVCNKCFYNAPNEGSICGTKWLGCSERERKPVSGLMILLLLDGKVIDFDVTDNQGEYCFEGLAPGNYTVQEAPTTEQLEQWYYFDPSDGKRLVTLGCCEEKEDIDFYNAPYGSICGTKYLGCDGKYEKVEDLTIELYRWDDTANGGGWVYVTETQTLADGTYCFDGLKPGKYKVVEVPTAEQAALWYFVNPVDGYIEVTLGCCEEKEDIDFYNAPFGSICGTKYLGCKGDYETVEGLTIELWMWLQAATKDGGAQVLNGGGWVYMTETKTLADGTYCFTGLKPGIYKLVEVPTAEQAALWYFVDPDDGNVEVTLECCENKEGVDFYNAPYGEICGYKFLDLDGDGIWDKGTEPGIEDVTVMLTHMVENGNGKDNTVLLNSSQLTTKTDEDGYFCFENLLPGKYSVEIDESTVPPGHYASTPNPVEVELKCGGSVEVLFGNAPYVDISGSKWEDLNCNGKKDTGEPGVPGVKIVLLDSDGNEVASTTTGADGSYSFTDLKPGVYTVKEALTNAQLAVWFTVSPTNGVHKEVKLLDGKDVEDLDFFNCRYGKIMGTKWVDDGDGLLNTSKDKRLAGMTVLLTGKTLLGTDVSYKTETDANGEYAFFGLVPGTYTVQEVYDSTKMAAINSDIVKLDVISGGEATVNFFNSEVTVAGEVVTPPAQPEVQGEVTLPATGLNQLPLLMAAGLLLLLGLIALMLGILKLRRS